MYKRQPQNGQELLTETGNVYGDLAIEYLNAIDGVGREDLFYGYNGDDIPTPETERSYMIKWLELAKENGKKVLVIDYCTTKAFIDSSYAKNFGKGYISFATKKELDVIPEYPEKPYNVNDSDITNLMKAKNFLYLINPARFTNKEEYLNALRATRYDLLIIDLFFNEEILTKEDVSSLREKANGGKRLVIAYMSIGEAEDYRYYWQEDWKPGHPDFIAEENPEWKGNYKVKYWDKDWQKIIYGNDDSYLKKILDAGFDGVYLDIIDAFEYFENK